MKLYLVHCGFYDPTLADGIYESHTNFFVAAISFEDARTRAKESPGFRERKMHVDGLQEINRVNGHLVTLIRNLELNETESQITSSRHRDLAKKPQPSLS